MKWEDLNKENIERVKDLYYDYIQNNKDIKYTNQFETFEEYMENHIKRCSRCNEIYDEDELKDYACEYDYLCECCYDDVFGEEKCYVDPHDAYIDNLIENGEW